MSGEVRHLHVLASEGLGDAYLPAAADAGPGGGGL